MKRIICVFICILLLSGCTVTEKSGEISENTSNWSVEMKTDVSETTTQTQITTSTTKELSEIITTRENTNSEFSTFPSTQVSTSQEDFAVPVSSNENKEFRGIWCAIYELAPKNKSEILYEKQIEEMMNNISSFGLTDVFVQVRANADSIYPSDYYEPNSKYATDGVLNFDALKIILEKAHNYQLKVHAWVNPYRICSDKTSISYVIPKSLSEGDIYDMGNSVYIRPQSENGKKLVIDAIREILSSYDVDGIHIDDYFYPTVNEEIDKEDYEKYISKGGKLSLSDYRKSNVNSLVSSIYTAVKSFGKDITFSISPQGNMENNLNSLYADVETWCSSEGYCDIIIPQIYYGFYNKAQPFASCLNKWIILCNKSPVKLLVGLAIYKAGQEDSYAGSGEKEWVLYNDIIKRQVECLRSCGITGFVLFSYHYVFGTDSAVLKEKENLKSILSQ